MKTSKKLKLCAVTLCVAVSLLFIYREDLAQGLLDAKNYTVGVLTNITIRQLLSLSTLSCILVTQLTLLLWRAAPTTPIRLTLITLNMYLWAGQFTFEMTDELMYLGSYRLLVNFLILVLFGWAFLAAPSGEIKKAEIGRLEWFGFPFFINIVIGQGKCTVPIFFGWEVLERRVTYTGAFQVQLQGGSKGTIGVNLWFKIVNPGLLDELDMEKQVKPLITRIFQPKLIEWALGIQIDDFLKSIRAIESKIKSELDYSKKNLGEMGLELEAVACSNPEQSKNVDMAQDLIEMIKKLRTDNIIPLDTAMKMAMVTSGNAQLVLLGNVSGGKGGKNNAGAFVDVDEKAPKSDKDKSAGGTATENKKLSAGPKEKYPLIPKVVIPGWWMILLLTAFVGWGKNQQNKTDQVTSREVAKEVVSTVKTIATYITPPFPKTLPTTVVLRDNGKREWIKGPDTDDEGWVTLVSKDPEVTRTRIRHIVYSTDSLSTHVVIEKEIPSGEIRQYSYDNGWYYHPNDAFKVKVTKEAPIEDAVRIRFKYLDPDHSNPKVITLTRENYIN